MRSSLSLLGVGLRVVVAMLADAIVDVFVEGVPWTFGDFWCAALVCEGSSSSSVSSLTMFCLGVLKSTGESVCVVGLEVLGSE
jgi:hypothetical protein